MVCASSAGADSLGRGKPWPPCLGDAGGSGAIFNPLLAELPWGVLLQGGQSCPPAKALVSLPGGLEFLSQLQTHV